MLREEYTGKKSPTIMELRAFLESKKIKPQEMSEVIRFVIRLTGSALSASYTAPPPKSPHLKALAPINYDHPGLAQDMADSMRR